MHLIQSIRLCHALSETIYTLCVSSEDAGKFAYLAERFPQLTYEVSEAPALDGALVSHREPLTRIGEVSRPLIFPHAIVERCREYWQPWRPHPLTFRGLMTPARRKALRKWHRTRPWRRATDVMVIASKRGREFPIKCWDDEYFDLLGRSEFVLCPNGDHIWTYRFFEAALCGAIPVVEQSAPVYDGFHYALMTDDVSGFVRSPEQAESNFERARVLLTVPLGQLEDSIQALLPPH